ncbi:MAG: sensor histidine kinase, partial [Gammaproteobacteria bacterium]
HGIEPLPGGGTVTVTGRTDRDDVVLTVSNPRTPGAPPREGNRVALDNIRQRFELAFGRRSGVTSEERADRYSVTLRFPRETGEA